MKLSPSPSINFGQLIALSLLLASSFVLAKNGSEMLLAAPDYSDIDPVEIHGDDWRNDEKEYKYDWRSKEEQDNSRMRYAYDSSYEDLQSRNRDRYNSDSDASELGDTRAPSQIRFQW